MDIEHLIKSNIKRQWDLYQVTLPNIEGYCEWVFYSHEWVTMDYLSSSFSDRLSFMKIDGNMHHIFLMSSICGSVFLRIIDTLDFYHDKLLIIRSWEFSSFVIKWRSYLVILYEDNFWEIWYYTNFEDGPIFQARYENHEFNIFNTLTGMTIHTCSRYPSEMREEILDPKTQETGNIHQLIIMEDALFGEKLELKKIKQFLKSNKWGWWLTVEKEKFTDNSLIVNYSQSTSGTLSEWEKLVGFLGTHQCILENPGNLREYISLDEVTDLDITMPESFMPSWIIDTLDPGWHKLRKTLMELEYITTVIRIHIRALEWSIETIDELDNPFLKLQKDHSTMTLIDLEKIEKTYTIYLTTLVALLKNSLP